MLGLVTLLYAISAIAIYPSLGAYVYRQTPGDVMRVVGLIVATPFIGTFPTSFASISSKLASRGIYPIKSAVGAANRVAHRCGALVGLLLIVSGTFITSATAPVEARVTSTSHGFSSVNHLIGKDVPDNSTFSVPGGLRVLDVTLPYRGIWTPSAEISRSSLDGPFASREALINSSELALPKSKAITSALPIFSATPDSGCTAHATAEGKRLTNKKPCAELFGDANGKVTRCISIGDMPVVARDDQGKLIRFTISNVREVPSFKYTLLSVTQLWKEQRVDARFADLNHLQFPIDAGGIAVPYDKTLALSTLVLISEPMLSTVETSPAKSLLVANHRALLGFHAPKSTSHIADEQGAGGRTDASSPTRRGR